MSKRFPPKLARGHVSGDLTVTDYIGQSHTNPITCVHLSKTHHWYRVRCTCGTTEVRAQEGLLDPRRHQCCVKCAKRRRTDAQSHERLHVPDNLRFERLRW